MSKQDDIIVIDSEKSIRALLCEYFDSLGYRVYAAPSITEGIDLIFAGGISVAVMDAGPSPEKAMASLDRLRQACPALRVILIMGYPTIDSVINALRRRVFDIALKPFLLEDLKDMVARALTAGVEDKTITDLQNRIILLENLLADNGIPLPDAGVDKKPEPYSRLGPAVKIGPQN